MKVTINANKKDISLNAKGEKIEGIGKPNVQMLPPGVEFDYNELKGKPSINGVTLEGNKTTKDLKIETISEEEFNNANKNIARNTKRIKTLETNIFDSGLAEGTSINIQDGALAEMQEVKMSIDKAQETTKGVQLLELIDRTLYIQDLTPSLALENPNKKWFINGFAASGYTNKNIVDYTIADNKLSFKQVREYYGIAFNINVEPNKNLIVSCEANKTVRLWNSFYDEKGLFIKRTGEKTIVPSNAKYDLITFDCNQSITDNEPVIITDIQVEYGEVATPYEPYTGGQASPNPSYPQEINKVVDNFEFTSCGKNLFDINKITNTSKITNTGASLIIKPNVYNPILQKLKEVAPTLIAENSYVFNANTPLPDKYCYLQGVNRLIYFNQLTKITQQDLDSMLVFYGDRSKEIEITNIEIVKEEDKNKPYTPYQAITNTIDLKGNEFLPGDEFTFKFNEEDGKYWSYLKKNMAREVFNGSENWKLWTVGNNNISFRLTNNNEIVNNQYPKIISNYFKYVNTAWELSEYGIFAFALYQKSLYFRPIDENMTTVEQFKTWLSTHNTEVVYELETPQLIPLAPIDIMNMTYNPITNVNTSIDNIKMTIKYYRDFIHTIRNLQVDSKKALALETQLQELETRLQALETKQASLDIEGGNENA